MTYEQAMSKNTITAYEAMSEILKHGLDFEDFASEYGERETYYSRDVLIWLGY